MSLRQVEVVCLMTGDALPNLYGERLYAMLSRHMGRPFGLTCLTDRPRPLPPEVRQVSIAGWPLLRPDMRPTQLKLRLFDGASAPFDEFFYMDVTLVLKSALAPLLDFADARPEPLAVRQDWYNDTFNSCVMRIRRSDALQAVYDDYAQGREYPVLLKGDQDYLTAVVRERGLAECVALIPPAHIASFKSLRQLWHRDPRRARRELDEACVLKFHGAPRPHEALSLGYRLRQALQAPRHALADARLAREIRRGWR